MTNPYETYEEQDARARDKAAEHALSRRLAAWWSRLHLALRAALVALPLVGTVAAAWATSQAQSSTVVRHEVQLGDHERRLQAVERLGERRDAEGSALRGEVEALRRATDNLRPLVERLDGRVETLLRMMERREPL